MTKRSTSTASRVTKLFKRGCTQVVPIPYEFESASDTALVTKDGNRLILESVAKRNFVPAPFLMILTHALRSLSSIALGE